MRLIVGLGNPGNKYKFTRHNVGFLAVESLRSKFNGDVWEENRKFKALICKLEALDAVLVKPTTFMNDSGVAVSALINFYHLEFANVYIIHDDLDIKLGGYKIQFGVGPKNHNGVGSVEEKLGTKNFWRVRIGIENRDVFGVPVGETYVLQKFTKGEKNVLEKVITSAVDDLLLRIDDCDL